MDVRFDADAAERLIKDIYGHCSGVKRETQNMIRFTRDAEGWKDNQKLAFENNVMEIAKDLDHAIAAEVEYMKIYSEKVRELRG